MSPYSYDKFKFVGALKNDNEKLRKEFKPFIENSPYKVEGIASTIGVNRRRLLEWRLGNLNLTYGELNLILKFMNEH